MKKSSSTNLYTGKKVFVSIDVHKRTYAVVSVDNIVVKKWQTVASPEAIDNQLNTLYPKSDIYSAYEVCFSGFVLHKAPEQSGIHSLVVNPASIEVSAHNRVQTDKRDAQKIASLLEAGRLRSIHIPSEEVEQQRLLTRTREQLIRERTSLKNIIRMRCPQFGSIVPDDHQLMRQLFSYTGLTLSEHSSGPSVRRRHITRQGNARVRFVLCEAAWQAIRRNESLKAFFNRLHPITGKKKAIVAVA